MPITEQEAGALIAFARALGLSIPDEPPEVMRRAWSMSLARYSYPDLERAALTLADRTTGDGWAAPLRPPQLAAEVRRIRERRLAREMPAPNADPDDPSAYAAELRALRDWVAAGGNEPRGVPIDADLARYAAGGTSLTGSHRSVKAITPTPDETAAGRRLGALLGIPSADPAPTEKP